MGSCPARHIVQNFAADLSGGVYGGQFLRRKLIFPKNIVSRHYISNLNMTICLNGPLVGAPELPIGHFCVKFCPGSNGTTPRPQNHHKNNKKSKQIGSAA